MYPRFGGGCQRDRPQKRAFGVFILVLIPVLALAGQTTQTGSEPSTVMQHPQTVTTLADLLKEAEYNNPRIRAARLAWEASKQMPSQVSTLPDPQLQVQHVSVGSPRPFAGYTNSDFAYIGLGVSQDIPYPGKLRLRGEVARADAEVARESYESVRRDVLGNLKAAYFQLAYISQTLGTFESDGRLLQQVEEAAEARYRGGMGTQQDVLRAQLERTKLLVQITHHHLQVGKLEAQIKQLLNREQSSAEIGPTRLVEEPLASTYEQLLAAAKTQNPEIGRAEKAVERQKLQVDLARKDFYPDFTLQYAWQRTDPSQFRAYYMLTLGVRVPIYRGRKQRPELAGAELEFQRSRTELDAQSQQTALELREQYEIVERNAEMLKIYRDGLAPQARATFEAALASYQNNRQDFQGVLATYLDVLRLDEEYWQNVADRETALAKLEDLTGLPLLAAESGKE
jgi:outer membrane protein, heavy metal efflux system